MDFTKATDKACEAITHVDIAEAAGVSVQTVRQARLSPESANHRPPPPGWQRVVARLAEERAGRLLELAKELRGADR